MVIDEGVIVEIVRPGTGDPVPEGEVGELVVTTLNPDYPLIRFGTGDLSAVLPGACPTGRSNQRIKGWMGRADQTAKVRGLFVHPSQVAEVLRRFPEVGKARLVISGEMAKDRMTLKAEVAAAPEHLGARLADAVREVTKLRAMWRLRRGSLPNDGTVIATPGVRVNPSGFTISSCRARQRLSSHSAPRQGPAHEKNLPPLCIPEASTPCQGTTDDHLVIPVARAAPRQAAPFRRSGAQRVRAEW